MSHSIVMEPHGSPHPSLRPVADTQRPPIVIRPFAAPVVRELPPPHVAAGTAW